MAKKHLSEDEIRYIISAESSEAQKAVHALTQENKSLKKEERERRKAMVELEAQGKKKLTLIVTFKKRLQRTLSAYPRIMTRLIASPGSSMSMLCRCAS